MIVLPHSPTHFTKWMSCYSLKNDRSRSPNWTQENANSKKKRRRAKRTIIFVFVYKVYRAVEEEEEEKNHPQSNGLDLQHR